MEEASERRGGPNGAEASRRRPTSTRIHQQPLITGSQTGQSDSSLRAQAVLGRFTQVRMELRGIKDLEARKLHVYTHNPGGGTCALPVTCVCLVAEVPPQVSGRISCCRALTCRTLSMLGRVRLHVSVSFLL